MTNRILALTGLPVAAALLWGCSPAPEGPAVDPAAASGSESGAGSSAASDCLLGTWNLDVADYQLQSAAFLDDLGAPIENFHFDGGQVLTITPNFITVETDMTATGTIVVRGFTGPVSAHTVSTANGDWHWQAGSAESTIDIENWQRTAATSEELAEGLAAPSVDFTDIPSVSANCSAGTLLLRGPDAPLSSSWSRAG